MIRQAKDMDRACLLKRLQATQNIATEYANGIRWYAVEGSAKCADAFCPVRQRGVFGNGPGIGASALCSIEKTLA